MNQSKTSSTGRLHIWPKTADVTEVRKIVESLNLGYTVKPFWFEHGVSEDVERVLVLADGFNNGVTVNYIYPKNPALLEESVRWALGIQEESRGAHMWEDTMKGIFGQDLIWESVTLDEGVWG